MPEAEKEPETRDELAFVVERLVASRCALLGRDPRSIAAVVERAAEQWLIDESPWMCRAVDALAAAGPFSQAMLRYALPRMIEPLVDGALERLIEREVGGWSALERVDSPTLVLHVLPSNLPGHAAIPSALTLLLCSAALLKPGRDDRVFAGMWIESIRRVDADVGACVASVYWAGGSREVEDYAMNAADVVIAAGGDAAVAALRARCGGRFIGHGSRLSVALVARDSLDDLAAAGVVDDVAIWDQRGCLSPQVCFIEGSLDDARAFARRVQAGLSGASEVLPPARMEVGEILDERRFRDRAEWRGFAAGETDLYAVDGPPGAGSIAIEREFRLESTPLHRCLRVVAVDDLARVAALLAQNPARIEAAGVAASPQRFEEIAHALHSAGLGHVVPLGTMQKPDLSWRQGNRPRIAEWCGIR